MPRNAAEWYGVRVTFRPGGQLRLSSMAVRRFSPLQGIAPGIAQGIAKKTGAGSGLQPVCPRVVGDSGRPDYMPGLAPRVWVLAQSSSSALHALALGV